jgi:hypothetical protein
MVLLKQELWSWWLREALSQDGPGLECGLGRGKGEWAWVVLKRSNLLLMETSLIDFSSICNASNFLGIYPSGPLIVR